MRRRDFIKAFVSAAAWPFSAHAQQQVGNVRKIGVLLGIRENDSESRSRVLAIRQALQELGWMEGRNLQIEYRWTRTGNDHAALALELLALAPDVILTGSTFAVPTFQREGSNIPLVFVQVPDPVAAGFVASLARPGGNTTGFTSYEHTIGGKWLGLLKEATPNVARVAVLINPLAPAWADTFHRMATVAHTLGMQLIAAPVKDARDIEQAIASVAREANPGLIVMPGPQASTNRAQIIALVAKFRLPAIYPYRYWVANGGVISYGIDTVYLHQQAASYVDRILRLGFDLPTTLLARADEVIE